jgi:putative protease
MDIITPIDKVEEVEALLNEGVAEFYGGFNPKEWLDRYTIYASMNQRYFESAQIKTFDDLKVITDEVHRFKKKFYFTMNSTLYSPSQYDMIKGFLPKLKEIGADGIIAADIGLILLIKRIIPDMPVRISTLGKAYNHTAVEFYKSLGVRRVVFPRHLTLDEMKKIAAKCPDIEYDIFMLIGKCPNIEGYCSSI